MRSTVQTIDYVVLVGYLCLMAGVGAYFMRFMRAGTDFLKGGNVENRYTLPFTLITKDNLSEFLK